MLPEHVGRILRSKKVITANDPPQKTERHFGSWVGATVVLNEILSKIDQKWSKIGTFFKIN